MQIRLLALLVAAGATTACARGTTIESSAGEVGSVTPMTARTLPAGATMTARLDQTLATGSSNVGDAFTATVINNVVAQNGATVVPVGAVLHGHITGLQASTNASQPAVIKLDFDSLVTNSRSYPFDASIDATTVRSSGPSTTQTVQKATAGAAIGAVLGGVLSKGDLSKILIGGALGAAAGTAVSLGTGDVHGTLAAGTTLTLRTTQTVAMY